MIRVRLARINSIMPEDAWKRFEYVLATEKQWLISAIKKVERIEDGEYRFIVLANNTLLHTTDKQLPKDVKRRKGYKVFTSCDEAWDYIREKNRVRFNDVRYKTRRLGNKQTKS